MLDRIIKFLRDEAVLCIAFICALVSIVMTGDYASTPSYIDWRVIALLFCLMASVAGLSESGVMARIAQGLIAGEKSRRSVCLALILLPFFASMLVTNDVALLTFVPIAVLALQTAGWRDSLARVIVLQAIAANLGGMVTPVGNPQNLFIFTAYGLTAQDFFFALAPFGALSFVLLVAACLTFDGNRSQVTLKLDAKAINFRRFALHAALFVLSVLSVLHILPHEVLIIVIAAALFIFDRRIFAKIDYALLATFACFFIFSGNMAHMPSMQEMLGGLMRGHPMITSLVTSQIISNVPASVLLAGFTANWHSLLIGVDLGGLGTPIASLASLIALKLYAHTEGARIISFMKDFAISNIVALAFMVTLYAVLFVL
ncbi:MAG: anion permease [Eggerthellaceae bacterium]|nr:anion permease [Eggerthellaceae bacterium]